MMGYAGVWYGYAAAHGVRLPKDLDTGVGAVTKANMDDPVLRGPARRQQAQALALRRQLTMTVAGQSGRGAADRPGGHRARFGEGGMQALIQRAPVETYVIGFTLALWLVLTLVAPNFLTAGNVSNMMRQVAISGIIAVGVLCTIIIAGIDLSVGSVAAFCGVLLAQLLSHGWRPAARGRGRAGRRGRHRHAERRRDRQARHPRLHRDARRAAGLSRPRAADRRRRDGRRAAARHQGLRPRQLARHPEPLLGHAGGRGRRFTTCCASPAPGAISTRSDRTPRRRAGRAFRSSASR